MKNSNRFEISPWSELNSVSGLSLYTKIKNFWTIKLLDKILSESLFVQNPVMSERFEFIANGEAQRNMTWK